MYFALNISTRNQQNFPPDFDAKISSRLFRQKVIPTPMQSKKAMSVPCIKVKANIDPIRPARRCYRKAIFIQVVIVLCINHCGSTFQDQKNKTLGKLTDMTDECFQAIIPTPPLQKTYQRTQKRQVCQFKSRQHPRQTNNSSKIQ